MLTLTGRGEAGELGARLLKVIASTPVVTTAGPLAVTASIGCVVLGDGALDAHAMLEAADAAMYEAKRSGRNRVCVA